MTNGHLPLAVLIELTTLEHLLLHFPAVVRSYRLLYGLPRETLAKAAGMSHRALVDIEKGHTQATVAQAAALFRAILRAEAEERARPEQLPEPGTGYVSPGVRLARNLEQER